MEAQLATIPRAQRPAANVVDGHIEFTFKNEADLYRFLSREISLRKMKHSKFAQKADMSPTTVSRMVKGETNFPRFATVFHMLNALGYELVVKS